MPNSAAPFAPSPSGPRSHLTAGAGALLAPAPAGGGLGEEQPLAPADEESQFRPLCVLCVLCALAFYPLRLSACFASLR